MTKPRSFPRPPRGLSAASRALWGQILDQHAIDDAAGRALLETLCRAVDGLSACEARIAQDGLMVPTGPTGALRPHPLLSAEAEYRRAVFAATRALKLDVTSQE